VYRIIHYWQSINPYYYPEILDELWLNCWKEDDANVPLECVKKEISREYESCVTQAINFVDPIRAAVIFSLCAGIGDCDEDLISSKVSECIDKHRHLVMRMGERVPRFKYVI
jgi:hypothetical protein